MRDAANMAGMKKNVTLYTPDGKTTFYANIQNDSIDAYGILTFTNDKGDKIFTTTLPFKIVESD